MFCIGISTIPELFRFRDFTTSNLYTISISNICRSSFMFEIQQPLFWKIQVSDISFERILCIRSNTIPELFRVWEFYH